MASLSAKENFLRLLKGDIPEWVPSYSYYGPLPGVDEDPPNMSVQNPAIPMRVPGDTPNTFKSMWGVPYSAVENVGGFSLPTPNEFILKDIRKWRDVIKAPDLSDVNWETVAKDALSKLPYDREKVSMWYGPGGGYFQMLMSFMGFTEGLLAMHEEPEEVLELFNYLHNFYLPIAKKYIEYVNPDVMALGDDTAAERAPFISPTMFREMLVPYYDDFARLARNRGIPINFHNCGKAETLMYELVPIGVCSWEPVQLQNDIHEVQRKYGRHLVIGGGWEGRGRLTELDVTDEEIRQSVRDAMDAYAKNGGFMFAAAYTPGSTNDERTKHWNEVLQKEAHDYGKTFYKK